MHKLLQVESRKRREIINITNNVRKEVKKSGIKEGMAIVSTPHTTCSIIINEDESGLLNDILDRLEYLLPQGAGYRHDKIDDNADAHMQASLIGPSKTIPIVGGKLSIGTWQSVLFIEHDGPRRRNITIQVFRE